MPTTLDSTLLFPAFPTAVILVRLDEAIPPLRPSAERDAVANAVPKRRLEFAAGRHAARLALAALGADGDTLLPPDHTGAPRWPKGYAGSISHCDKCAVAVVASSRAAAAVGIDIEPDLPLPHEALPEIFSAGERHSLAGDPQRLRTARMLFSAKEAVQKVLLAVDGRPVDLRDIAISLDVAGGRFCCTGPERIAGRLLLHREHVIASAWMRNHAPQIPINASMTPNLLIRRLCSLFVLATLPACSGPTHTPPAGISSFEGVYLPLTVNDHGVPKLSVETSAGPLNLILDTGADQALLLREDSPIIASLERVGSEMKFDAAGGLRLTPVYRLNEVAIGPLRFTEVSAPLESSAFPEFMPGDGVLGRALLAEMTLDIDLPNQRFGILPPADLPDDFAEREWIEAPLLGYDDGPVIAVRLDESEEVLRMVLDTGAIATGPEGRYGVVELPADLTAEPDPVEGLPVYRADEVRVGERSLGSMPFFVMHHPQPPGTQGFLGNVLFAGRRVIINPMLERVYISAD